MARPLTGAMSATSRLSLAIAIPFLASSAVTLVRVLDSRTFDVSTWFEVSVGVGVVGALVGTWILANGQRERSLAFIVGIVIYDFVMVPAVVGFAFLVEAFFA